MLSLSFFTQVLRQECTAVSSLVILLNKNPDSRQSHEAVHIYFDHIFFELKTQVLTLAFYVTSVSGHTSSLGCFGGPFADHHSSH